MQNAIKEWRPIPRSCDMLTLNLIADSDRLWSPEVPCHLPMLSDSCPLHTSCLCRQPGLLISSPQFYGPQRENQLEPDMNHTKEVPQFPEQTNPPKMTDDAGNEHGKHGHQGRWAIAGVGSSGREHGAEHSRW